MSPNPRTSLFMNLREHLKAASLQFFERPQERQLLLMMRTESMTFVQVVTVRPDGVGIRVETKLPLVVPVHRRLAAAELMARLNRVTERGHYDLDIDTGDVVFRIDAHALGNVLFPGLLVKLLSMTLQPVVRDWPVLEGVLLRDEDSREAIRINAERIARLHEEQQRAEGTKERPRKPRKPDEKRRKARESLQKFLEQFDGGNDPSPKPDGGRPDTGTPPAAGPGDAGPPPEPAN